MKFLLMVLITVSSGSQAFAQNDSASVNDQHTLYTDYILLKNFIGIGKKNPGTFSTNIKPRWNSKFYQQQYQQLLAFNKQKEFYPELIFDNRYVSHSVPYRYGSQNYRWVSTQHTYKNVGEQIASDVISDVVGAMLSSKKGRFNTGNKKGYYTPVGLRY